MDRVSNIFYIGAICLSILSAQDTDSIQAPLNSVITQQNYDDEYYGITQIKERQMLITKKSGKYIGMGFGGVKIKKDYEEKVYVSPPVVLSLKTGAQTFFNKSIGIRGFFALDIASNVVSYKFSKDSNRSFYTLFSLGVDIITEFPLSKNSKHFLGAFVGLGGGVSFYMDSEDFNTFKTAIYTAGLLAEGGITLNIFVKHRIEFGVKALPDVKKRLNNRSFEISLMPYVMYNYKF